MPQGDYQPNIVNPEQDPLEPEVSDRTERLKLIANDFVESGEEYNKQAGFDEPRIQHRIVWESDERFHDDGTPYIFYDNLNTQYLDKKSGKLRGFGPGGWPQQRVAAFEELGIPISPKSVDAKDILGHLFDCKRVRFVSPYGDKWVWFPVKYLGSSV
mgnify:FL=1